MCGERRRAVCRSGAGSAALLGAALATGAPAVPQESLQQQVFAFRGVEVGEALGAAAVAVGDLDGDGRTELALGAPNPIGAQSGYVRVVDGATGAERLRIPAPPLERGASARFGAALALLEDLDGDGVSELAIGIPRDDGGGQDAGAVELRSVLDGHLLHRFEGLAGEQLGSTLATADLDADGLPDLVAGAPGGDAVIGWSSAWIRSSLLGEVPSGTQQILVATGSGRFGTSLAGLGDLDGDGAHELAVGAPVDDGQVGPRCGSVSVLSAGGGSLLARLEGATADEGLGAALAALPSVDGDPWPELAVGAPGAGPDRRGAVRLWRGAWLRDGSGAPLWLDLAGASAGDLLGSALADAPDTDGDGLADWLVLAARAEAPDGLARVELRSGADGGLLWTVAADGADEGFGAALGALELVDDAVGAGLPEILLGAPLEGLDERGRLRVSTLVPRRLAIDPHRLSVDEGGSALLSLDAGASLGGQLYVLIGSFTGVAPGLATAAGALPVNFDGYSLYTLSNPPDLIAFNGPLDAQGRAQAQVVLPPKTPPGLSQFQLHYAWFSVDLGAPGFPTTAVSNAVPLGFDVDDCTTVDPALDCNGNGVLDLCDIADGTSADCDGDGVPDECQFAAPGADEDHDGVLDACRTVVHVDADALGAGDGSSWADAFTDLRVALAQAPELAELWVAEGTYRPWPDATNDAASLTLRDGLALFGGFAGHETSRDQRDPDLHPTVLSGDLAGDDGKPGGSTAENAWNVVAVPEGVGPTTVLDGFTVRGGNADEIAGCDVFAIYFSSCRGGGLYCLGSPTVRDCRFESNFGGHHGGGVFTTGAPTFVECLFEANGALRGGALYADIGARPRLVNCVLRGNQALEGGAVYAIGGGADGVELSNCLVAGNHAAEEGGGLAVLGAEALLRQTTLASNSTGGATGGLIGLEGGSARIDNSILWGNTGGAPSVLGRQLDVFDVTVRFSCVQGGSSGLGGPGNFAADPLFVAPAGPDGVLGTADDDLRLGAGSPCRDAGDTALVPADGGDLDGDGDRDEPLPLDLDGLPRVTDDPVAPDVGLSGPTGAVVDLGPYES